MRLGETFLAVTSLLAACASAPAPQPVSAAQGKPFPQHVDAPICARLAEGESVHELDVWPAALGDTVGEVRDHCAAVMGDPEFCPYATSVGLSRTASLQAGLLPQSLADEARKRCLDLLGPKGKGSKCVPSGGMGIHIIQ